MKLQPCRHSCKVLSRPLQSKKCCWRTQRQRLKSSGGSWQKLTLLTISQSNWGRQR